MMITLGIGDIKQRQWAQRTRKMLCTRCGGFVQSTNGRYVYCKCPEGERIGIAGTVYDEFSNLGHEDYMVVER